MLNRLRTHARPLARLGCISIGTVYVLVGVFALLALAGVLTGSADEYRMIHIIRTLPGGALFIWILVLGLLGYVLWRVAEMVADPYEFGTTARGLATRAGIGLSAALYGLVAFAVGRTVSGYAGHDGEASEAEQQVFVGRVLEWPAGEWLVGGAGVLIVGFALLQLALVVNGRYTTEVCMSRRTRATRRLIHALARYGYSARAVILGVLGYFLIRTAFSRDPADVGDTDTAFDFIGGGVVGDSAFFIVAAGTIAYGMFMYVTAAYYQFEK